MLPSTPLILLWMVLVSVDTSVVGAGGYDRGVNYWEAFAPGKLLQRLDALTLADDRSLANGLPAQLASAQAKLDVDVDAETDVDVDAAVDSAEEQLDTADDVSVDTEAADHSAEADSGEDYERNYEKFVRQYFDRVPYDNDADDDDDVDDNAEVQLDGSIETQAEASNVQGQQKPKDRQKRQQCRRVHRNGQLCTICREPRNNEVSETCSYSHEAEPEKYAYDAGSQYKRYRDRSPPAEDDAGKQRKRSERHTDTTTRTTVSEPKRDDSLCVRRQHGKSICYDCKDSNGSRMTRCYDAATNKTKMQQTQTHSQGKPRGQQTKQSEQQQRIYKRTISYSYAQDDSSQPQDNNSTLAEIRNTPERSTAPARRQQRTLH